VVDNGSLDMLDTDSFTVEAWVRTVHLELPDGVQQGEPGAPQATARSALDERRVPQLLGERRDNPGSAAGRGPTTARPTLPTTSGTTSSAAGTAVRTPPMSWWTA
jgi:hypothetical protein